MKFKMFTGKHPQKDFEKWLEINTITSEVVSLTESGSYGITTISIFYTTTEAE